MVRLRDPAVARRRRRARPGRGHRRSGGGRRGRAERLPLRGHRHRARRRRRAGRDPRRRLVPRADGRRRPHGHRRGLHRRAVPPLPARRHRRAEPAVDGDLPQRRPPGRGRASPPTSPRPAPTPNRSGSAIADGGTYAWHDHRVHWMAESSPPVDRGEQVGGRVRPVAGADRRGRSAARRCRGSSCTRSRCPRSPTSAWRSSSAGLLGVLRPRSGPAPRRRPPGGGRPRRGRGRLGRLLVHPRRRREPAALGAGRRRAGDGDRRGRAWPTVASVSCWPSPASPPLSGWALFRIEVLFKPVLPTELPAALDRTVVALALGVERRRRRDRGPGQRPEAPRPSRRRRRRPTTSRSS